MANVINSRFPSAKFVDESISFPEFVLKHFVEYGDKVALISPKTNETITYSDLIHQSRKLAIGLRRNAGIREKDVVSICTSNRADLFQIMLGVNLLGAVVNTANPAYTVRELVNQFVGCKTRIVLTTSDLVKKMEAAKAQCPCIVALVTLDRRVNGCLYLPDLMACKDEGDFKAPSINAKTDLALLLHSSGTTGLPKAVMLTHRTLVVNLCQVSRRYLEHPAPSLYTPGVDDVFLSALPLFHVGGIISAGFWVLVNGGTLLVFDRYDPNTYLEAFRKYKVTTLFTPPPVLVHYTKSTAAKKEDFASLKYVVCGAGVINKELEQAVAEKMNPDYIVQVFGMTELSPVGLMIPLVPLSWQKSGSCGVVVPNTQCKVIDIKTGEALGPGSRGEICVRGPQMMAGYLNNEKATRETIDDHGWLHTGDIGYYDDDEYFYVVDRIKDIIKVKGFQVAPAELEGILFTHPGVADVAVVGAPDGYAGEVPRAYVVLKRGVKVTEEKIKQFMAEKVVSYKRLAGGVEFVNEIPKTASGKYLRKVLRDQAHRNEKSKL